MAIKIDTLSTDTFFNGQLTVKQEKKGYRFSLDAIVLASHIRPKPGERVLDLGTGCGIVPLMLAYQNKDIQMYGIEVQESLADIAMLNIEENRMINRVRILCKDMKGLKSDDINGPVNIVVSNPPYRKAEAGRINPNHQKALAKHEINVTLDDVLKTAKRMLVSSGRFISVYTAERLTDLLLSMRNVDMEPKYFRMIHPDIYSPAKLILVEGAKGGNAGMKNGSPLILYNEDGSYTKEVQGMFSG